LAWGLPAVEATGDPRPSSGLSHLGSVRANPHAIRVTRQARDADTKTIETKYAIWAPPKA
jgi:hypothetical protein